MQYSQNMYYNQIRAIHLITRLLSKHVNHYNALGLTKHATQSEIKGAYYKLSMLYHPDKNSDAEAAQKFRDITAAYEILGNIKLRKLYDKGVMRPDQITDVEDDDQAKFYKAHRDRAKPPTPTGRTPIYNFDEWSKVHYAYNFNKKLRSKQRFESQVQHNLWSHRRNKREHVILGFGLLVIMVLFMSFDMTTDRFDEVSNLYTIKEENNIEDNELLINVSDK